MSSSWTLSFFKCRSWFEKCWRSRYTSTAQHVSSYAHEVIVPCCCCFFCRAEWCSIDNCFVNRSSYWEILRCFLFDGIVFSAIVRVTNTGVAIPVGGELTSPSMQMNGDCGMLHLNSDESFIITSFQKCCTGGQSPIAWK